MSRISYGVQLNHLNKSLGPTLKYYRSVVRYLVDIVLIHYDEIKDLSSNSAQQYIEHLVHGTKNRKAVYLAYDKRFYKFPSYYSRSAISCAIGKVSSYKELVRLWEKSGCTGRKPRLNLNQDVMPCFYKGNTFHYDHERGYQIKVYRNNDWVWQDIELRETDIRYIRNNFPDQEPSAPMLRKSNKKFMLQFTFDANRPDAPKFIKDTEVQKAVGVDLGINTDAVCTSMLRDGTVTGCKFINSPVEKDRMYTLLNVIKGAQQHGSRRMPRLWAFVDDYNTHIAVKTASAIVKYAVEQKASVIVFENLKNTKGRFHGSKKQRLSLWRKREIQSRTEAMAKRYGIRTAYVCAWNTSKLAYDGSGIVSRDENNHSLCTFITGKRYNCDLSASKNIAARYFIRAVEKSTEATRWLQASAKVPELCTRTRCTLSTLINLNAVITA